MAPHAGGSRLVVVTEATALGRVTRKRVWAIRLSAASLRLLGQVPAPGEMVVERAWTPLAEGIDAGLLNKGMNPDR